MPNEEKKGWKSTKSTKKWGSASHPPTSSTHASAGQQLDASHQAQASVEKPNTGQYLHEGHVEPAGFAVTTHDQCSYSQASNYAAIEHEGDTSQLQLWAYEIYDDNLTFAERLEKVKWEVERLVRL